MEMYGLEEDIVNNILLITKEYPQFTFKLFGSRARKDFKKTSDIDIAIFKDVPREEEYKIRDAFDKLDIIYKIDLVFVNEKVNKELLKSIKRDGVDL